MNEPLDADGARAEVAAELGVSPEQLAALSRGLAAAQGLKILVEVLCRATTGKEPATLLSLMLRARK